MAFPATLKPALLEPVFRLSMPVRTETSRLLMKDVALMLVVPEPPDFRKTPLLVKVARLLQHIELSPRASKTPVFLIAAELFKAIWPVLDQMTLPALLIVLPSRVLPLLPAILVTADAARLVVPVPDIVPLVHVSTPVTVKVCVPV